MSDLAKTCGLSTAKLTIDEKTYSLKPFNVEDYGAFEAWLEEKAWEALRRAAKKSWLTGAEYDKIAQATVTLIASQQFAYGTPAYSEASLSLPGLKKFLALAIPELDEKQVHEIVNKHTAEVVAAILANHELSQ